MNPPDHAPASALLRANWILWLALCLGPLMFAGIAAVLVLTSQPGGVLGGQDDGGSLSADSLRTILAVVATSIIGGAFLLPSLLPVRLPDRDGDVRALREERDPARREALLDALVPRVVTAYRARAIVAWAVAEGGALLAAMSLLLTGMDLLPVAVLAVYVVFMAVTAPTRSRLARSVEDVLGDRGVTLHEWERHTGAI